MFRVSLKSLFVAITIVAVAFVLTDGVSVKDPTTAILVFAVMLLSLFVGLITYDKMYGRAFGIGAVIPLLFFLTCLLFPVRLAISIEFLAICMILIPVCGCITMLVRKILTPKSADQESETPRSTLLHELVTGLILGMFFGGIICFIVEATGILKPDNYYQQMIDTPAQAQAESNSRRMILD